ncbi:MAG TPA: sigma-70 family RNA polymerase sigma factor [Arachidicoccus sp.]
MYSEAKLLLMLSNDEEGALEIIYRTYWKELYAYAFSFIANTVIVEDILQETFLYVWKKRKQIHIEESILGYLKISVRNNCFRHIKAGKVFTELNEHEGSEYSLAISYLNAEDGVVLKETQYRINNILGHLPKKMKTVFLLRKEEGLSYKEIGNILHITEETVKKQLYKAKKLITKYIN